MAHDVFISYSAKNKVIADAVCATLEGAGTRCWIAPRDVLPGEDWAPAIVAAIASSRLFVLVFSAAANASPQVMREVERAVHAALPVIPFRVEDVVPSGGMAYYISATNWLDAMTPPLEKHLGRLTETVQILLSRQPPPDAPGGGATDAPNVGALWREAVRLYELAEYDQALETLETARRAVAAGPRPNAAQNRTGQHAC